MVDFDIDKICRVCMQSDIEVTFLFDERNAVNGVCLSDMISECTMYTVRRFDGFPDLICTDCVERVRIAYAFKKQFETSHRKIISFLEMKFVLNDQPSDANDKCIQTDDTSLYPCEKCDEKFISYERLREHRTIAHKGTANLCRLCSKTFNRIADLKNHIAVCHPEAGHVTPNECSICSKKFIRKDHVLRHMRMVHKIPEDTEETKESSENCNPKDCDILEETEIDVVPEPDSDVISAFDPVDGSEVKSCKDEMVISKESEIDNSLDQNSKLEISNCVPWSSDEDECFTDGLVEKNSFSSDEDEKPLSTLLSSNITEHRGDSIIKEELHEIPNTVLPEIASPVEKQKIPSAKRMESSSNRRFKCSQCDKVFTRSNHVKRHLLSHSQEKPFSCHMCNKRFSRADHLKIHLTNHNTDKPYKCYTCDRGFSRSDLLNRHCKQKHEGEKLARSEICKFCNRSFSSKYYLQKHIRVHTDRFWKCKFCEIEFDCKESLKEHTKSHSTEKPFLCSECGQCFIRKDYLLIHMRRHNGEKPYKCKYCEKGFPRATDLKVHERYHTGEKTHLCTICGKGFQRGYNLVVHMRVHTGERPYQCPHCPKNFSQGNDLKVHVRRHTGERFKCQICGTEFMQAYNLTQHNQTVHGIEDKTRKGRVAKVKSEKLSKELSLDVASRITEQVAIIE